MVSAYSGIYVIFESCNKETKMLWESGLHTKQYVHMIRHYNILLCPQRWMNLSDMIELVSNSSPYRRPESIGGAPCANRKSPVAFYLTEGRDAYTLGKRDHVSARRAIVMPIGSLGLGVCFHFRLFFYGAEAPVLFQIFYLELRKSFSFSKLENLAVGGAVEGAVADGFRDVATEDRSRDRFFGRHGARIVKVSYSTGYPQDAVEGAG